MAAKKRANFAAAHETLRQAALGYPEATEDHPWGETAIKVKGKVFLFLNQGDSGLSLSTKLPSSANVALGLSFAKPTGYGLGKSGWVTAIFEPGDDVPVEMLLAWLDESYRAVAPKKLSATLDGGEPAKAAPKTPSKAANTTKKATRPKTPAR